MFIQLKSLITVPKDGYTEAYLKPHKTKSVALANVISVEPAEVRIKRTSLLTVDNMNPLGIIVEEVTHVVYLNGMTEVFDEKYADVIKLVGAVPVGIMGEA